MKKKVESTRPYGQTIRIEHFLNTQVSPRVEFSKGESVQTYTYPIYVLITVKRQTTRLRSDLPDWISIEKFDAFKSKHKKKLQVEIDAYQRQIEKAKPFEDSEFTISDALRRVGHIDFGSLIHWCLEEEFKVAMKVDLLNAYARDEYLYPNPSQKIAPAEIHSLAKREIEDKVARFTGQYRYLDARTVKTFAVSEYPATLELWNRYEKELWLYSDYCKLMKIAFKDYCMLIDWLSGEFDERFMDLWQDEVALANFHAGFEKLTANHERIRELVKKYTDEKKVS